MIHGSAATPIQRCNLIPDYRSLPWSGPRRLDLLRASELPETPGLYFLTQSSRLLTLDADTALPDAFLWDATDLRPVYIGRALNLRRELVQHKRGRESHVIARLEIDQPLYVHWAETDDTKIRERVFIRAAFGTLVRAEVTRGDLEAAVAILSRAQCATERPEIVGQEIAHSIPALAPLAQLLVPKTAGDFYGLVNVLLLLVVWLLQHFDQAPHCSPDVVINQVVEQISIVEAPSSQGAPGTATILFQHVQAASTEIPNAPGTADATHKPKATDP